MIKITQRITLTNRQFIDAMPGRPYNIFVRACFQDNRPDFFRFEFFKAGDNLIIHLRAQRIEPATIIERNITDLLLNFRDYHLFSPC